ncbi:hypothetical protein Goari_014444 [Gossypium aridum]|uniref:RNase H type-1 domain-containing protein n=1 Tax=Gossypium aridum TaxID=34290 RepID=A0A7J8XJE4_GOSAI|nr:hypothetical protein [Gossypium aridum]
MRFRSSGGVARRPSGGWLFSLKMTISITYIFQIEAKTVLEAVSNVVEIQMINDLCLKDWRVNFRSIRGTNNKVTNRLAKMISNDIDHLVVLEESSSKIKSLLEEDIRSSILVESSSN